MIKFHQAILLILKYVLGLRTFTKPTDPFCDDGLVHQTFLVQTLMRCFRCLSWDFREMFWLGHLRGMATIQPDEQYVAAFQNLSSVQWQASSLELEAYLKTDLASGQTAVHNLCGACDSLRSWHIEEDRETWQRSIFIDEDGTCQVCDAHQETVLTECTWPKDVLYCSGEVL